MSSFRVEEVPDQGSQDVTVNGRSGVKVVDRKETGRYGKQGGIEARSEGTGGTDRGRRSVPLGRSKSFHAQALNEPATTGEAQRGHADRTSEDE